MNFHANQWLAQSDQVPEMGQLPHYVPTQYSIGSSSSQDLPQPLQRSLTIFMSQEPSQAKATPNNNTPKTQSPIDPPPFLQLLHASPLDLQSPWLTCTTFLEPADSERSSEEELKRVAGLLNGTMVSSLHRLKNQENKDGGYFCFPDLYVKQAGTYVLHFVLLQKLDIEVPEPGQVPEEWSVIAERRSAKFTVYNNKEFPGMQESTFLTRSFSDQGVKVRLRKDSRAQATRKRNNAVGKTFDKMRAFTVVGNVDADSRASKKQRSSSNMTLSDDPSTTMIPQGSYAPYATSQPMAPLQSLPPVLHPSPLESHRTISQAFANETMWSNSPEVQPQVSAYHSPVTMAAQTPQSEFTFAPHPYSLVSHAEQTPNLPSFQHLQHQVSDHSNGSTSPRGNGYVHSNSQFPTPASSSGGLDGKNYTTSPIQPPIPGMQFGEYQNAFHHGQAYDHNNGIMTPLTGNLPDTHYYCSHSSETPTKSEHRF